MRYYEAAILDIMAIGNWIYKLNSVINAQKKYWSALGTAITVEKFKLPGAQIRSFCKSA
jgi:hypothetical protein